MTQMRNYPKQFVERTQRLLAVLEPQAKKEDLEVTLLLNCLLGMVVTVLENKTLVGNQALRKRLSDAIPRDLIPKKLVWFKKSEIRDKYAEEVEKLELLKDWPKTEWDIGNIRLVAESRESVLQKDFLDFLRVLRNGIAHQNIAPVNKKQRWAGVRIWNVNPSGVKDFAVEFTVGELRKLTDHIVNVYLANVN